MCGRFTNLMSWREIVSRYRLANASLAPNLRPRLDIRPTDPVLIVRPASAGGREAAIAMWWFVPSWAREQGKAYSMFNARSETIDERKSFADAFRRRPASGFYEWRDEGKKRKTRYYVTTRSGAPLTFAGLWERNEKLGIESCTIIVCAPNRMLSTLHDRMPVILAEDDWDAWLAEPRKDVLRPAPDDDLVAYPVASDIRDEDSPARLAPPLV